MATVINNSESVNKFCNELLDAAEHLRDQLKKTEQAMDDVAQEWKDPQFKKYNDEFTKDKEKIEPLCKKIEEYESDILRPIYRILYKYENL